MTSKGASKKPKRIAVPRIPEYATLAEAAPESTAAPEPIPGVFTQLSKDTLVRICTIVLFAATFWQILALGFYLDDWGFILTVDRTGGAAFSLDRWRASYAATAYVRPGETPFWYFLTSLLGGETILWHLALFSVNVLLGLLLLKIVRKFTGESPSLLTTRIIYLNILFWFVLPWNATFHFWPTDVLVLAVVILFCGCILFAIERWEQGSWALWVPLFGYLWACITYEALYFQWIPIAVLGGTLIREKRTAIKPVLYGVAAFVAAQAGAVAWYMISLRTAENRMMPHWIQVFFWNLANLPSEILRSTQETKWLFLVSLVLWLAVVAGAYLRALTDGEAKRPALLSLTRIGACLSGILLSIFAFSLGGRRLTGVGIDARVFLLANFWFVVAGAFAAAFCWTYYESRGRRRHLAALLLATIAGGSALLASHMRRAFEWAEGWRLQQQILAEAPVSDMKKMEPDAAVLLVKPIDYHAVPTLSASWDVSAAMYLTHPVTKGHMFDVYNPWRGPAKWDGQRLTYPDDRVGKPMQHLYIWQPMEREFFKAIPPIQVNQDLTVHPLTPGHR